MFNIIIGVIQIGLLFLIYRQLAGIKAHHNGLKIFLAKAFESLHAKLHSIKETINNAVHK